MYIHINSMRALVLLAAAAACSALRVTPVLTPVNPSTFTDSWYATLRGAARTIDLARNFSMVTQSPLASHADVDYDPARDEYAVSWTIDTRARDLTLVVGAQNTLGVLDVGPAATLCWSLGYILWGPEPDHMCYADDTRVAAACDAFPECARGARVAGTDLPVVLLHGAHHVWAPHGVPVQTLVVGELEAGIAPLVHTPAPVPTVTRGNYNAIVVGTAAVPDLVFHYNHRTRTVTAGRAFHPDPVDAACLVFLVVFSVSLYLYIMSLPTVFVDPPKRPSLQDLPKKARMRAISARYGPDVLRFCTLAVSVAAVTIYVDDKDTLSAVYSHYTSHDEAYMALTVMQYTVYTLFGVFVAAVLTGERFIAERVVYGSTIHFGLVVTMLHTSDPGFAAIVIGGIDTVCIYYRLHGTVSAAYMLVCGKKRWLRAAVDTLAEAAVTVVSLYVSFTVVLKRMVMTIFVSGEIPSHILVLWLVSFMAVVVAHVHYVQVIHKSIF